MTQSTLEHVNVTVRDADASAALLCDLFGWRVRWRGDAIRGGISVHVGTDADYLALYTPAGASADKPKTHETISGLNHIGVVVDDLDAVEARVRAAGLNPCNHADYEPGRRFYFDDPDGIEYEVVSYAPARTAERTAS